MKKYMVTGSVGVSCWTYVEAESEAEAIKIAKRRQMCEVHIDGTYDADEYWNIDTDGEPQDLEAKEA